MLYEIMDSRSAAVKRKVIAGGVFRFHIEGFLPVLLAIYAIINRLLKET